MNVNLDGPEGSGDTAEPLPRLEVRLQFEGVDRADFSLDEVSARLGVLPTRSFKRGEPRRHQSPLSSDIAIHGRDVWLCRAEPKDTLDLRPLLQELRDEIPVSPGEIKAMCVELGIEASVMVGVSGPEEARWPICVFPPDFLEWTVGMGASLDVDYI